MRKPLFRGAKRWLLPMCGLMLSSILFAACGEDSPSIFNTVGPVAHDETFLFWIILIISVIIFVGVEGWLIMSIVRYRDRPGRPAPEQYHGNLKIEMIWTIAPAVVLLVVLAFTINGLLRVAPEAQPADPNTVTVEAIGHQWWWEFYYPQYKITTADSLYVPENTVVHVDLYSNNVIHSFWVPAITGKTDVVPGHNNTKWFIANKTGSYEGECAEFCGTQHANMRFTVNVDTKDGYQSWVTTQQQAAANPTSSQAAQGLAIFKAQCSTCHGIVGVNLTTEADPSKACNDPDKAAADVCKVGPNLTHFGSRRLIAGWVLENHPEDCTPGPDLLQKCQLAQWLQNTQKYKPGNDMQVNLTTDQINQLVVYLEGLK